MSSPLGSAACSTQINDALPYQHCEHAAHEKEADEYDQEGAFIAGSFELNGAEPVFGGDVHHLPIGPPLGRRLRRSASAVGGLSVFLLQD